MTLWQIIDVLIVGWAPLLIDGTFSPEETKRRIGDLATASDSFALPLAIVVNGDRVDAGYQFIPDSDMPSGPGHSSMLSFFRPVFRGRLITNAIVHLDGAFGGNWIVRFLALAAIVLTAFMTVGAAVPSLGRIAHMYWAIPLIFIGACIVSRINAADDIRLITNNLIYALRGDD